MYEIIEKFDPNLVRINWKNLAKLKEMLNDIINENNPIRTTDTYSDTCDEKKPYIEFMVPPLGLIDKTFIMHHGDYVYRKNKKEYPVFITELTNLHKSKEKNL